MGSAQLNATSGVATQKTAESSNRSKCRRFKALENCGWVFGTISASGSSVRRDDGFFRSARPCDPGPLRNDESADEDGAQAESPAVRPDDPTLLLTVQTGPLGPDIRQSRHSVQPRCS